MISAHTIGTMANGRLNATLRPRVLERLDVRSLSFETEPIEREIGYFNSGGGRAGTTNWAEFDERSHLDSD